MDVSVWEVSYLELYRYKKEGDFMLADTLTGATGTFNKRQADSQSGSLYTLGDAQISIKHNLPAPGKSGTKRHLVQVVIPHMVDNGEEEVATGSYTTVNLTIVEPTTPVNTGDGPSKALADLAKILFPGYTSGLTTFGTAVLDGSF